MIDLSKIDQEKANFAKFKYPEPFCAKVMCQDKWPAHCKRDQSFKFRRATTANQYIEASLCLLPNVFLTFSKQI